MCKVYNRSIEKAGKFLESAHKSNDNEHNPTLLQVIAEAYHMMKDNLGMNAGEIGKVMEGWNKTELDSYLMEISANILQVIMIIFFVNEN